MFSHPRWSWPRALCHCSSIARTGGLRIGPQRAVKKVAGADAVDLDIVFHQFQREGLGQPNAAEFASRIGPVAVRSLQARLGIDLDDVAEIVRLGQVWMPLSRSHDRRGAGAAHSKIDDRNPACSWRWASAYLYRGPVPCAISRTV